MNLKDARAMRKGRALAWQRCDHLLERAKNDDAVYTLALRIYWWTLGIACAVLGSTLFFF
jgi:hypothetical protein